MDESRNLVLKPIRRVSPSRYTAMRSCLLREVWTAAGNEPLLSPSPLAELGTVIHELLGVAGRGELEDGGHDGIERTWVDLVALAEKRMALSALQRHQVPLTRSIPDYEVRKLRAFHRAAEIAGVAVRAHGGRPRQGREHTGCEVWVESHDGQIGGYIDRATMTEEGVVLSDYKSGAVLISEKGTCSHVAGRAHKEQLLLYAALYRLTFRVWPARLEIVPLQGTAVAVPYDADEAEGLLADAVAFLQDANRRIAEVENGCGQTAGLASPCAGNCRICLFRPACQAYWSARTQGAQAKWPADVRGSVYDVTRLRNGKVCMRIAQREPLTPSCITVRNLTAGVARHPLLHKAQPGATVALYGLERSYHSGDYAETQNTVIFATDSSVTT
jgi:hypothetical protein